MRLLVVPLTVLALLGVAPLASAVEADEADESALVEEALEECEGELLCEEEAEAEETEAEAEAAETYPAECALRSVRAHAVLRNDKLKLTIGYTTSEPAKANVDVHYGATRIGQFKRRLGRSGVLRLTRAVKGKKAPKRLPVRIEVDLEGAPCASRRLVLVPKR